MAQNNRWCLSADSRFREGYFDITEIVSPMIEKGTLDRLCKWLIKGMGGTAGVLTRTDDEGRIHVEEEYIL